MKTIFTVGYEGAEIAEFVEELAERGIQIILDVRELPLSRKRGFSKRALSAALERAGIDYKHIGELGDPKSGRQAARNGDLVGFRKIFKRHLATKTAQDALDQVVRIAAASPACLLCFEREPENCHRSMVAEELAARDRFVVVHLAAGLVKKAENGHAIPARYSVA